MKCKDIPDLPILKFLSEWEVEWRSMRSRPVGATHHDITPADRYYIPTVREAMPSGIHGNLVLAKMGMLIRRGLVCGCTCGCRGDFTITEKGERFLSQTAGATS